jgi:SET domain-containing protein
MQRAPEGDARALGKVAHPSTDNSRRWTPPPRPLPAFLEVKQSLIAGAGMGLFATRRLLADRRIGRYRGDVYFSVSASDLVPEHHKPYLMATVEDGFIDGYTLRNHMRWANHSADAPNAYAHLENDGVVFFYTLRRIEAGEEILIDYGYDPTVSERDESIARMLHCAASK